MLSQLTDAVRETIRSAARKLTGFRRRQFQAEVAKQYCQGSARRAEQVFGWGRAAVETGLNELRTGIRCLDHFSARGRHKTEQRVNLVFGTSRDTSDFVADCLDLWWRDRQAAHPGVNRLLIDLDNGPEIASSRTQFMKRLVEFSDRTRLTLELAYYPPYHSKYNRIERCWGILENHWNGTLLNSIATTLAWARTMTWHGVAPIVHLLDRVYKTGVRLTKPAFRPIANRLERSTNLPKWSVVIQPRSW